MRQIEEKSQKIVYQVVYYWAFFQLDVMIELTFVVICRFQIGSNRKTERKNPFLFWADMFYFVI